MFVQPIPVLGFKIKTILVQIWPMKVSKIYFKTYNLKGRTMPYQGQKRVSRIKSNVSPVSGLVDAKVSPVSWLAYENAKPFMGFGLV